VKSIVLATALMGAALLPACAQNAPAKGAMAATTIAQTKSETSANVGTDMTEGEVRKLDRERGNITLKHGDIKNLDMPAMTMVFKAKDKAMLDALKLGDKVRFKAIDQDGKFMVTEIEVVK
jgi:Cu(I)/Ag(I) efflux system periplasmic protein CusF